MQMTLENYFLAFLQVQTSLNLRPGLEIRLDPTERLSFDNHKVSQALEVSRVSGLHAGVDKPILILLAPLFLQLLYIQGRKKTQEFQIVFTMCRFP